MSSPSVANTEKARAAVEEVLTSEAFARSEQLRSFLRYVCERTLAGHGKEINEYSIAVEALGKPADFAPGEDSSVRRSAYELRQKLQKYYEVERPAASVRIELPKGSYTPRFIEAAPKPLTPPARTSTSRLLAAAFVVLLAAVLALTLLLASRRDRLDPVVREAWQPLVPPSGQVLISVGTTLHLVVRPYVSTVAEGLPKYPAPPELYPLFRQHRPLPAGTELSMHPVDNSVQMGHAESVAIAASVLSLMGRSYQILPERSASSPALRGRSTILIGDPQNSVTAANRLANTPLTLEFDPAVQDVVVRDRASPRTTWAGKRGPDNPYTEVYGLITMLPGEGETAGPHRTLIFSGLTSVGAHGAAEFFSRPEGLTVFLRHLASEGYRGFPSAYQVVVRCASSDTLLVSTEYAAHRVIAR
ncbi:MAG TPA: hypothetical protein VMH28_18345 [Candidatus Acidoferrales bacterium]|nr:hypothetical protein [Candidatus Acidoferrales bacterium]